MKGKRLMEDNINKWQMNDSWKWIVIWIALTWKDPDVLDAIIYFLTKQGDKMSSGEQFSNLMQEMKISSSKVRSGEWTLSDYYFRMCDFFKQIEPSQGYHYGNPFDFREDAKEFKQLAIKELENEK